jgi:hypothetical protein
MPDIDRDRERVLSGIARVRARWMRVHVLASALRSLFYAGLVATVLVLLLDVDPWMVVLAVAAAALVWSLASPLYHLPSRAAVAKACDDRLGLADRLASACQLDAPADPLVSLLHEEAAGAASTLEPARIFPFRIPREGWLLPLPAILFVAVLLLPSLSAEPAPDPLLEETITARLEDLREMLSREKAKEPTPERKELVEELERLVAELSRDKVDKKEAMAELARSMERLNDSQEKQLEELKKLLEALRSGDKTAQAVAEQIDKGDLSSSLSKLEQLEEDLQKKLQELDKKAGDPAEKKELEKELANLKEIKAKLAKLAQLEGDFGDLGEALDFLEDFEGKLGDVKDLVKGVKLVKLDCKCDKPGT